MTVRMKWTGPNDEDEDESVEEQIDNWEDPDGAQRPAPQKKFNKNNRCECVWQGLAAVQRLFSGALFQAVESPQQARKVLKSRGAEHYVLGSGGATAAAAAKPCWCCYWSIATQAGAAGRRGARTR